MAGPLPGAKVRNGGVSKFVTVITEPAMKPPSKVVTVIVVAPAALAVTSPVPLMVAMAVLLEAQMNEG